MKKIKLVILKSEHINDYKLWEKSCLKYNSQVDYRIVDLTKSTWLKDIQEQPADCLLTKPGGIRAAFKNLYDERVYILEKEFNYLVYPSYREVLLYENKRFLSYWLQAQNIPHPRTNVFYYKNEALSFIYKAGFPLVTKLNIGASGKGVEIFYSRNAAAKYINDLFRTGKSSVTGPRISKGKLIKRLWNKITNPEALRERISTYKTIAGEKQSEFIIFQEFIKHDFEWRVVRIGDSFFAHKKMKRGDKASGSLIKLYEDPPKSLLDFVKEITDKFGFRSQALDIFQTDDGDYLVNEVQCIFGQSDPYQMLVYGKPGRYRFSEKGWIFEEGLFNTNQSFDLRIEDVISLILKG